MAAPRPSGPSGQPSLLDLPSFSKRSKHNMESSSEDELDFGGDDHDPTAPARRPRGTWRPSRGGRSGRSSGPTLRPSLGAFNRSRNHQETGEESRRGFGAPKRARLGHVQDERASPQSKPVVIKEEESSSLSRSDDGDMPRRVSPPAEVFWASRPAVSLPAPLPFRPISLLSSLHGNTRTAGPTTTVPLLSPMAPPPVQSGRGALPPDHPLQLHLNALLQARQTRKMQWAGLIESLGDEFRNPASHDRHLWMREEQLADEAIAETMMRIKMAEQGLPDLGTSEMERIRHEQQGWTVDVRGEIGTRYPHRGRHHGGRDQRGRDQRGRGWSSRQRGGRQMEVALHQQDWNGRRHTNFKTRKTGAPSRKPMQWSDERKDDAVRAWLGEMGMPMPAEGGDSLMDSTEGKLIREEGYEPASSFISLGGGHDSDDGDEDVMMRGMEELPDGYIPRLRMATEERMEQDGFDRQEKESSLFEDALERMEVEAEKEIKEEEREDEERLPDARSGYQVPRYTTYFTTPPIEGTGPLATEHEFMCERLGSGSSEDLYADSLTGRDARRTGGNPPSMTDHVEPTIKQEEVEEEDGMMTDGEGSGWMELGSMSSGSTVPMNEQEVIEKERRREEERKRVQEMEKVRALEAVNAGVRVMDLSAELSGEDLLLSWDDARTGAGVTMEGTGATADAERDLLTAAGAMNPDQASKMASTGAVDGKVGVNADVSAAMRPGKGGWTEDGLTRKDATILISTGTSTYSLPLRTRVPSHDDGSNRADGGKFMEASNDYRDEERKGEEVARSGSISTDDDEDVFEDAMEERESRHEDTIHDNNLIDVNDEAVKEEEEEEEEEEGGVVQDRADELKRLHIHDEVLVQEEERVVAQDPGQPGDEDTKDVEVIEGDEHDKEKKKEAEITAASAAAASAATNANDNEGEEEEKTTTDNNTKNETGPTLLQDLEALLREYARELE